MKYMIFCGMTYYPAGGWKDFKHATIDLDSAIEYVVSIEEPHDWWQIVDAETMAIVKEKK